jgi:hypothetical protein
MNWPRRTILAGACVLLLTTCTSWPSLAGGVRERPPATADALPSCLAMMIDQGTHRCRTNQAMFDRAAAPVPSVGGTWRLLRTPDPAGGRNAISIMQIADVTRSDLGFAGMMLRCGEVAPEILIVLVEPLPPRAHPKVMIAAGSVPVQFTATVLPPGVLILMPPEATALAEGPWQNSPELAIAVSHERDSIRGVIVLVGFSAAWQTLKTNCQLR